MAAELDRLAQKFRQRGHPEMADYLGVGVQRARELGIPESFPGSAGSWFAHGWSF